MTADSELAPAKLNLALHVRAWRDDGYHELETLFAFTDRGDAVSVENSDTLSLRLTGPFANALTADEDNLVLAAARLLHDRARSGAGARLTLDKQLPVASGIGGGSADAAATLRLLDRFWQLDLGVAGLMPFARQLGSDVPACLLGRTAIGIGRGEELRLIDSDLAGRPLLLVNPGVAVATADIFARWDGVDRGAMPAGPPSRILSDGRNDLTPAACELAPAAQEALDLLGTSGAEHVRMSGSGATCFALYSDTATRDAADRLVASERPRWWTMACRLA